MQKINENFITDKKKQKVMSKKEPQMEKLEIKLKTLTPVWTGGRKKQSITSIENLKIIRS